MGCNRGGATGTNDNFAQPSSILEWLPRRQMLDYEPIIEENLAGHKTCERQFLLCGSIFFQDSDSKIAHNKNVLSRSGF